MSEIDTRFLHSGQQIHFDRKYRAKVSEWYGVVLEAFQPRPELPYTPTLFITPFYVSAESRDGEKTYRRHDLALTLVHPDDPKNRWAIFLTYNIIRNAPADFNMANLAHELTHFYSRVKGIDHTLGIIKAMKQDKSDFELEQITEREVKNKEELFREPIRSMLRKMEARHRKFTPEVAGYLKDAPRVTDDEFYVIVFGRDGAKKLFQDGILRIWSSLESQVGERSRYS